MGIEVTTGAGEPERERKNAELGLISMRSGWSPKRGFLWMGLQSLKEKVEGEKLTITKNWQWQRA